MAKKVLVVDDEKAIARAMEIKLNKSDLTAKAVFSGSEAIEELIKEKYDLVLLDIMMPETDGWEVMRVIKEKKITVKIVITSNLSQEEDINRAKAMGASSFLVKSNSTLEGIIEEVKSLL